VLKKRNTAFFLTTALGVGVSISSIMLITDSNTETYSQSNNLGYSVMSTCDSPSDSIVSNGCDTDTAKSEKGLKKDISRNNSSESLSLFLDNDFTPDRFIAEQDVDLETDTKSANTKASSAQTLVASDTEKRANSRKAAASSTLVTTNTEKAEKRANSRKAAASSTLVTTDTEKAEKRANSRKTAASSTPVTTDTEKAEKRANSRKAAVSSTPVTTDTDDNKESPTVNKTTDLDTLPATSNTEIKPTIIPPKKYHFDMQHYCQLPEMPTGCEIVSTRAVLEYYGISVTYEDMMKHISTAQLKSTKDGKLYGKSPYQAFLGDPTKYSGFGCYPPVITEMIENYNFDNLYVESTCNMSLDFLAKTYVTKDIPVLVWATIGMGPSYLTSTWFVEGGNGKPTKQKYTWRANEHCLVLLGYDENYYYFNDPMSTAKVVKYDKSLVEKRYKEVGCNSLIIRDYE